MAGPLRLGLTGGIGSGKSSVAARLQALGATCIDTDAIARALTGPGGAAIPALNERFGADCLDAQGALDRPRMRERVFADPALRAALEAVLHPLIGAEVDRLASAAATARCLVFDVPLLVESGRWRARVDRVLVVDCAPEVQIERVVRRSHWTPQAVQDVIHQQAPRALRRAAADAVIDNPGDDMAVLHAAVDALAARWIAPTH